MKWTEFRFYKNGQFVRKDLHLDKLLDKSFPIVFLRLGTSDLKTCLSSVQAAFLLSSIPNSL